MLKTQNVYVDTEQWRGIRFDWSNDLAQAVLAATTSRRMSLLVTDVLDGEIRAHLRKGVKNYVDALRKAESGKSFSLGSVTGAWKEINFEHLQERIGVQLEQAAYRFFSACKATRIRHRADVVDVVLKNYFEGNLPFEDRTDKKHEFPDAIALDSLDFWCKSAGTTSYVVSQDRGVTAYCEASDRLIPVDTLASLVREMNAGSPEDEVVKGLLETHGTQISEAIKEAVMEMDVHLADFQEDKAKITEAEIAIRRADLIFRPSDSEYVAYVDIRAELSVVASGDDQRSWVRDSETGEIVHLHKIQHRYRAALEAPFKVGVRQDEGALEVLFAQPVGDDSIIVAVDWIDGAKDGIIEAYLGVDEIPF